MLIAFRDYIQTGVVIDQIDGFQPGAPASNLQDRRLGVPARLLERTGPGLQCTLDTAQPIGIVAILAHNMGASVQSTIELQDLIEGDWVSVYSAFVDVWQPAADSFFPRHHIVVLPEQYNARRILYTNAATSTIDGNPFTAGRFWAGPVWRPEGKTSASDFSARIMDDSTVNKSVGQQIYVDYVARYRQLSCSIPYMTEAEAFGAEDGDTLNLQDIAFEVGRGGAILVIPSQSNNQIIHKTGVYGHFYEPPSINLTGSNKEMGRLYTTNFEVVEDL